jgi:hypothetical protein
MYVLSVSVSSVSTPAGGCYWKSSENRLSLVKNPPFPRFTTVTEETLGFFRIPSESYFPTKGLHFSYVYLPFPSGFSSFKSKFDGRSKNILFFAAF